MIQGFEQHTAELTPEERAILPKLISGLSKRIGKKQAITNKKMRDFLKTRGIELSDIRMRKLVNHIRIKGHVKLLCATSNGYYIARTDAEIKEYLEGLKQRIDSQKHVYNVLNEQYKSLRA